MKYIFVLGGVMSGVGKGITTSSIGKILQLNEIKTTAIKIDPYVNVDAGTMNPTEHGETFVLNDGLECDQDMGNYERFLNTSLSKESYMTTGSVYLKIIQKERSLGYQGKTVSVVPDVPLSIIDQIKNAGKKEKAEVVLVEIGGTLGEYQNILFLEAARILKYQEPENVLVVMVSYLPIPNKVGEMKTKPTQQAVTLIRESGLNPDIIIGRSEKEIDEKRKEKIAFYANLQKDEIISAPDLKSIYFVPEVFLKQNLDKIIIKKLGLKKKRNLNKIKKWKEFVQKIKKSEKSENKIKIAIVGKYFDTGDFVLRDSYISVIEALKFASWKKELNLEILWVNSKKIEKGDKEEWEKIYQANGILVPGGFGKTGVEGKIQAIKYARENKIPFLGICYGMQMAVVEFARNVLGWKDANTTEINPKTTYPVIDILEEQKEKMEKKDFGGSMRLGAYPALLKKGSLIASLYHKEKIEERHRHRYEFNFKFKKYFEDKGMEFGAVSPDGKLMEAVEIKKHPFFLGVQYHPELKARPEKSHPVFDGFLKSVLKNSWNQK